MRTRFILGVISFAIVCSLTFARPLGTFTLGSTTSSFCPTSPSTASCWNFTVTATGLLSTSGEIAVETPVIPIVAVDVFFSLESGSGFWGGQPNPGSQNTTDFFTNLLAAGHQIILVKWTGSWYTQTNHAELGPLVCAVRGATAMQWVKDNYASSVRFNVIGTSNGAALIAYALAYYNITMNVAVVDSGPPELAMKKGCEVFAGYELDSNGKQIYDSTYGYSSGGPCVTVNTGFESRWIADSVETSGIYSYPGVIVHVIRGSNDNDFIRNRASDYTDLLTAASQPVTLHTVTGMAHGIMGNVSGLNVAYAALTTSPTPTPTATATATATVTPTATPSATCGCCAAH